MEFSHGPSPRVGIKKPRKIVKGRMKVTLTRVQVVGRERREKTPDGVRGLQVEPNGRTFVSLDFRPLNVSESVNDSLPHY